MKFKTDDVEKAINKGESDTLLLVKDYDSKETRWATMRNAILKDKATNKLYTIKYFVGNNDHTSFDFIEEDYIDLDEVDDDYWVVELKELIKRVGEETILSKMNQDAIADYAVKHLGLDTLEEWIIATDDIDILSMLNDEVIAQYAIDELGVDTEEGWIESGAGWMEDMHDAYD